MQKSYFYLIIRQRAQQQYHLISTRVITALHSIVELSRIVRTTNGPTRARELSCIEIPAAHPIPKKEFPRRGTGHSRRVHRAQNSESEGRKEVPHLSAVGVGQ